jgi:hypothetical protein
MREAKIKESSGEVNSNMMYLIHCKNLCKCHKCTPTQHSNKGKIIKNNKENKIKKKFLKMYCYIHCILNYMLRELFISRTERIYLLIFYSSIDFSV